MPRQPRPQGWFNLDGELPRESDSLALLAADAPKAVDYMIRTFEHLSDFKEALDILGIAEYYV